MKIVVGFLVLFSVVVAQAQSQKSNPRVYENVKTAPKVVKGKNLK